MAQDKARDKQEADERWRLYRQLVERAWDDAAFRKELQEHPEEVIAREIKAAGLDIPVGKIVILDLDTEQLTHFCIPVMGWPTC